MSQGSKQIANGHWVPCPVSEDESGEFTGLKVSVSEGYVRQIVKRRIDEVIPKELYEKAQNISKELIDSGTWLSPYSSAFHNLKYFKLINWLQEEV